MFELELFSNSRPLSLLAEWDSEGREVVSHPYSYEMDRQAVNVKMIEN